MTNLLKFFSEIEDVVYSSKNKLEADTIINGYQRLFNHVNFNDYRLSLQKNSLKIAIKHKAFANKIFLFYNGKDYFLEDKAVDLDSINDLLPTFFIITLDKKEKIKYSA